MKREDQYCWNCDFWKPYEEEDRDPDYDRGGYCGEPSPLEWEQGDHGASPPWVHSGAWCWRWEEYREEVMPDAGGIRNDAGSTDVTEAGECTWGGHSKWCGEGCTCFFSDGAPMPEATDCPIHGESAFDVVKRVANRVPEPHRTRIKDIVHGTPGQSESALDYANRRASGRAVDPNACTCDLATLNTVKTDPHCPVHGTPGQDLDKWTCGNCGVVLTILPSECPNCAYPIGPKLKDEPPETGPDPESEPGEDSSDLVERCARKMVDKLSPGGWNRSVTDEDRSACRAVIEETRAAMMEESDKCQKVRGWQRADSFLTVEAWLRSQIEED